MDEAAIGVAKAAVQNASVPPFMPAMRVPKAMMVDVSKYVPVPFTGSGEPQMLLQEFRNWKGKWSLAERKLKDSPHVTDEVLQTQLLNALSGEARDMVSSLPAGSYDKAMEQLTAIFGDSFQLAVSYIPATGGEAGTTKKQKFRAAAAMIGNLELVLLVPAQRAWHLHNAQERRNHSAANPADVFPSWTDSVLVSSCTLYACTLLSSILEIQ